MIDHKALREALAAGISPVVSSTGWVAREQPTLEETKKGRKARKRARKAAEKEARKAREAEKAEEVIPQWITDKAKGAAEHVATLNLEEFHCFRVCRIGPSCPACGGGQPHRTSSEGPAPLSPQRKISKEQRAQWVEARIICRGERIVQDDAYAFKDALVIAGVPLGFIKF